MRRATIVLSCVMVCLLLSACASEYDKEKDSVATVVRAQVLDTAARPLAPPTQGTATDVRDTTFVAPPVGDFVIDPGGIGRARLNQTLDEARRAVPRATFTRATDAAGAILVGVTFGPDTAIVLFADESPDDSTINWTKRIVYVETFSRAFHTAEGVRPGSLVSEVQKIYGPVKEIVVSEIECRQYVEFERQPPRMTFRLDYTGDFPENSRTTKTYSPGARIFSVAVH